jgi:lipopolysaccharide cholinephosphotransferase
MKIEKQLTFDEQKAVSYLILKQFAEFCDEHGLVYYLAYGTLIGAIRHNGYIPWDDDIDVWMPRADYDKLLESFNREKRFPELKLISPFDKGARHTFVKIINTDTVKIETGTTYRDTFLGVDIDVFPLDGQPTEEKAFLKYFKRLDLRYKIHLCSILDHKHGSMKRRLAAGVAALIPQFMIRRMIKKCDKLAKCYDYSTATYIGSKASLYNYTNDRYKKEDFSERIKVRFEDADFYAPVGYDKILRSLYKDYMQLPPEEKRVTHHANQCYWVEAKEENEGS